IRGKKGRHGNVHGADHAQLPQLAGSRGQPGGRTAVPHSGQRAHERGYSERTPTVLDGQSEILGGGTEGVQLPLAESRRSNGRSAARSTSRSGQTARELGQRRGTEIR